MPEKKVSFDFVLNAVELEVMRRIPTADKRGNPYRLDVGGFLNHTASEIKEVCLRLEDLGLIAITYYPLKPMLFGVERSTYGTAYMDSVREQGKEG